MSVRQVAADDWRQHLRAANLPDLSPLLSPSFSPDQHDGTWTALTKPGLGGRERWRWEPAEPGETPVVYVKRYQHTPLREQLDRFFRQYCNHSRAWWEYEQSVRLSEAYFPVPAAVGVVEQMCGWLERRSAVLLAAVPGDAFDRVWQRYVADNAPVTHGIPRHDIAARIGRFVSAFHQTGLCHRDLYLCHIFAEMDPSGECPPSFWLIDLARTLRPRLRRMRWILKDLSQLDYSACRIGATRTDRMRCLLAYLGLQHGSPRARWYARRVARRSQRIHRREIRKGRA
ncbi:MAG: hypothetical protein JXO22_00970 [Phycisphaerae bacterium]|nr:hypothetical protein [Phycisphaerae bacterium]